MRRTWITKSRPSKEGIMNLSEELVAEIAAAEAAGRTPGHRRTQGHGGRLRQHQER